ncbi:MAG: hypothetical protein GY953_16630, partial [bacterium]|nr:hypothetical protein [bacterium]
FVELQFSSGILVPWRLTTEVRVTPEAHPFPPPLSNVLAANFLPLTAGESIVTAFGTGLASSDISAPSRPLPLELDGISVRITDSAGAVSLAGLFFVSPTQINYLLTPGLALGLATVDVLRDNQRISRGAVIVDPIAPGLFSANGDGQGVAASVAITVRPGGPEIARFVFDENAAPGSRTPVPIDLGGPNDQVFLLLFGTGMRGVSGVVSATIGGQPVAVAGPVPQSQFEGVEQVNLGPLPRSLIGAGEVEIRLIVDGKATNVLTVTIL